MRLFVCTLLVTMVVAALLMDDAEGCSSRRRRRRTGLEFEADENLRKVLEETRSLLDNLEEETIQLDARELEDNLEETGQLDAPELEDMQEEDSYQTTGRPEFPAASK
ncbi:hypothetical protein Bbelb_300450 [Branchiostoma belcheri]|nr:hypothetical protein Bbelb_300450 [Branchiostoma belcheri]